jgi:protein-tyrosine-phosphatase
MLVHFVCTGNAYRSRLAEAYFNSKAVDGLRATSSGTAADRNSNGPITWYAARIIQRERLVPYMSHTWTQTTAEMLHSADLVVFLAQDHHDFCRERFGIDQVATRTWSVPDVDEVDLTGCANAAEREARLTAVTEETFAQIQALVDGLLAILPAPDPAR